MVRVAIVIQITDLLTGKPVAGRAVVNARFPRALFYIAFLAVDGDDTTFTAVAGNVRGVHLPLLRGLLDPSVAVRPQHLAGTAVKTAKRDQVFINFNFTHDWVIT